MVISTKTKINEVLANEIQEHIKKIMYRYQIGVIPGMQGWFNIHQIKCVSSHPLRTEII